MPCIQLGHRSRRQVHGEHRPSQARQFVGMDLTLPIGQDRLHRHIECLPSFGWDLEFARGEVHLEAKLPLLLRWDPTALGHVDPQPRPNEIPFHPT